jgi:outer membrane protein TolC
MRLRPLLAATLVTALLPRAHGQPAASSTTATAPAPATTAAAAPAPAGERVSLRDVLRVAVRGNPGLASAAVDLVVAQAQIEQSRGVDDWLLSGKANWTSSRSVPIAGQPFQQTALDQITLGFGVSRALADGGSVGLELGAGYAHARSHYSLDMGAGLVEGNGSSDSYSPSLAITFSQPLLRGFGEDTARAARRRAEASRDVTVLEREATAATVIRDVVAAYWELAYAARNVEIRREALALAREQLRVTEARIAAGVGARTDLTAVQEGIARREEELLLAEQARSERALDLRQLAGMEIGPDHVDLVAVDRPELATPPSLEEALAQAHERNPQLRTLRARGRAAQIEVEVTRNGLLPQLDFQASAGPTATAAGPGTALEQMVTFDAFEVSAGLVFSMPIGNRASEGAAAAAAGNLRKARLGEADVDAQIKVAVIKAHNLVLSAQKRIDVLAKASELARVNLDAEKARFEVGRSTNFEVLKRQEELAEAELAQARAEIDYAKALTSLESLTGDLLPRYGIELK